MKDHESTECKTKNAYLSMYDCFFFGGGDVAGKINLNNQNTWVETNKCLNGRLKHFCKCCNIKQST